MRDRGNMVMGVLHLIVLALSLAPLTGCHEKATFKAADAAEYFPLHPGSTWTYMLMDKRRGQFDQDFNTFQVINLRVLDEKRLAAKDDGSEMVCEYTRREHNCGSTLLYSIAGDYITRTNILDGLPVNLSTENRFLPRLLKPGLSWSDTLFPFDHLPKAFHVTQTHRTSLEDGDIVVAERHFSGCIRVETDAIYEASFVSPMHLIYMDWYAPHVGLVRTRVFMDGYRRSEIARIELLSYSVRQNRKTTSDVQ